MDRRDARAHARRGGVRPLLLPGRHRSPDAGDHARRAARGGAARAAGTDARAAGQPRHAHRPECGRRTAELVPGATYVEFEGMGHDYPPAVWDRWIDTW